jgi:hypothetical protein
MSETVGEAMMLAGWRYELETDGYRKGRLWVSRHQAEEALAAADKGEAYEPAQGLSETFAEILVSGGMNDNGV